MNKKLGACGIIFGVLGFAYYAFSQSPINEECRAIPSNISCVDLAIGISAVDDAFTSSGLSFTDLGALFTAVKGDAALFAQANTTLNSVGVASFATLDSFYAAVNKCGLIPQVIDEIND